MDGFKGIPQDFTNRENIDSKKFTTGIKTDELDTVSLSDVSTNFFPTELTIIQFESEKGAADV